MALRLRSQVARERSQALSDLARERRILYLLADVTPVTPSDVDTLTT